MAFWFVSSFAEGECGTLEDPSDAVQLKHRINAGFVFRDACEDRQTVDDVRPPDH